MHNPDRNPVREIISRVSEFLSGGEIQAVAITDNGSIIWVPPEAWRITSWYGDRLLAPIEIAFEADEISIPRRGGSFDRVRPLISYHDIGNMFAAQNLPPVPHLRPVYLPEYAPSPDSSDSTGSGTRARAAEQLAPPPRKTGGRPVTRDWDAFWIEVAIYAAANDLELEHRHELQRHMREWASQHAVNPLDDATIRKKLALLYARKSPPNSVLRG